MGRDSPRHSKVVLKTPNVPKTAEDFCPGKGWGMDPSDRSSLVVDHASANPRQIWLHLRKSSSRVSPHPFKASFWQKDAFFVSAMNFSTWLQRGLSFALRPVRWRHLSPSASQREELRLFSCTVHPSNACYIANNDALVSLAIAALPRYPPIKIHSWYGNTRRF